MKTIALLLITFSLSQTHGLFAQQQIEKQKTKPQTNVTTSKENKSKLNSDVQRQIDVLSVKIAKSPNNDRLYLQRIDLYNKLGQYHNVLNDLRTICSLETDPEIKELCELEVSDYIKFRKLDVP